MVRYSIVLYLHASIIYHRLRYGTVYIVLLACIYNIYHRLWYGTVYSIACVQKQILAVRFADPL